MVKTPYSTAHATFSPDNDEPTIRAISRRLLVAKRSATAPYHDQIDQLADLQVALADLGLHCMVASTVHEFDAGEILSGPAYTPLPVVVAGDLNSGSGTDQSTYGRGHRIADRHLDCHQAT